MFETEIRFLPEPKGIPTIYPDAPVGIMGGSPYGMSTEALELYVDSLINPTTNPDQPAVRMNLVYYKNGIPKVIRAEEFEQIALDEESEIERFKKSVVSRIVGANRVELQKANKIKRSA